MRLALFILILSMGAYGQTNVLDPEIPLSDPYAPIHSGPPMPPVGATNLNYTIYYVYNCEYQTNVHGVITEVRQVEVTNVVEKYAPTICMQIDSSTDLTNWTFTGQERFARLGTNNVEFYRVRVSIE